MCVLCFSAGLQAFPSSAEVLLAFCCEINPPQPAPATHPALRPGSPRLLRLRSSSCHPHPEGTSRSCGMRRYPAPQHSILPLPWKPKMPAVLPSWQRSAMPGGSQRWAGGTGGQGSAGFDRTGGGQRGRGVVLHGTAQHSTACTPRKGLEEVAQAQPERRGEVSPGPALFEAGGVRKPFLPGICRTRKNRMCKPRGVSPSSSAGLTSTGVRAPLEPREAAPSTALLNTVCPGISSVLIRNRIALSFSCPFKKVSGSINYKPTL